MPFQWRMEPNHQHNDLRHYKNTTTTPQLPHNSSKCIYSGCYTSRNNILCIFKIANFESDPTSKFTVGGGLQEYYFNCSQSDNYFGAVEFGGGQCDEQEYGVV